MTTAPRPAGPEEAGARAAELTDPNKHEQGRRPGHRLLDDHLDKITVNEVEDMFDPMVAVAASPGHAERDGGGNVGVPTACSSGNIC